MTKNHQLNHNIVNNLIKKSKIVIIIVCGWLRARLHMHSNKEEPARTETDLISNMTSFILSLSAMLEQLKKALTSYKPSSFLGFHDKEKSKKKKLGVQEFLTTIKDINTDTTADSNINEVISDTNKVFNAYDKLAQLNKKLEQNEFGGNLGKIIEKFKKSIDDSKKQFDNIISIYANDISTGLDDLRIQLSLLKQAISEEGSFAHAEYYKARLKGKENTIQTGIKAQQENVSRGKGKATQIDTDIEGITQNLYALQTKRLNLDWGLNAEAIVNQASARSSPSKAITPIDILLERHKINELHQSILLLEKEFLKQKSDEASRTFKMLAGDVFSAIDRSEIESKYLPWLEDARKSVNFVLPGSAELQAATFPDDTATSEIARSYFEDALSPIQTALSQDITKIDPYTGEKRAGSRVVRDKEEWLNDLKAKTKIFLEAEKLTIEDIKALANEFPEDKKDRKFAEFSILYSSKVSELKVIKSEAEKLLKAEGKEPTPRHPI